MSRTLATWAGIAAICLAILVAPIWAAQRDVATNADIGWLELTPVQTDDQRRDIDARCDSRHRLGCLRLF